MQGLFIFLAFAAFVAFIIGMIKPQLMVFWSQKKTRGMACLYLAAMVAFSIISGTISSGSVPAATGSGNSSQSEVVSEGASSAESQTAPSSAISSSAAPAPELKPYTAELSNGNYTAGIDFPAGTYTVTAVKGGGNVSTSNIYSGGMNALMGVGKDEMYEKEYKNISMPDGVVLTISNVTVKIVSKEDVDVTALKKRENSATKSVTLTSGNYVAGEDFEAGIYDITAVKGSGNVSSDNMYTGGLNAIMGIGKDDMYQEEFKNIVLDKDVTLTISGVTVKLDPSK